MGLRQFKRVGRGKGHFAGDRATPDCSSWVVCCWINSNTARGVVSTRTEPGPPLNRWRAAYRQRWGAETLEGCGGEFSFVAIAR